MPLLSVADVLALHAAAISLRLGRAVLLEGVPPHLVAVIPDAESKSEQVLVDLHALNNAGRLIDGSVPLLTWLTTAAHLAKTSPQSSVFLEALSKVNAVPPPTPSYRDAATRALAEALARERTRKQALEAAGVSVEEVNQRILELRRKLRTGG